MNAQIKETLRWLDELLLKYAAEFVVILFCLGMIAIVATALQRQPEGELSQRVEVLTKGLKDARASTTRGSSSFSSSLAPGIVEFLSSLGVFPSPDLLPLSS